MHPRSWAVTMFVGQALTFALMLLWPDLFGPSLMFVWVVVGALVAGPRVCTVLTAEAMVLTLVAGGFLEQLDSASFWIRLVVWSMASMAAVALAQRRVDRELLLSRLATTDSLTGLANRRLLEERLEAQLALRTQNGSFAVLCIDLDSFKEVNTVYGHTAGDAVLVAVASRLTGCVRGGDTVARVGGDEFVISAPNVSSVEAAAALCARIAATVAEPIRYGEILLRTGATIGAVVTSASMTSTVVDVLRAADEVLMALKLDAPGTIAVQEARLSESA